MSPDQNDIETIRLDQPDDVAAPRSRVPGSVIRKLARHALAARKSRYRYPDYLRGSYMIVDVESNFVVHMVWGFQHYGLTVGDVIEYASNFE